MRYKVVPPVRDVEFCYEAADLLPLVPGSVEDCCARLRDGTDLPSRDLAREMLTFLEALGLVAETERGYHRVRDQPDRAALAQAYRNRVFGVAEVLDALRAAEGPLTPDEAFDALREDVPEWERARHPDWEAVWRDRTRRLLDWTVEFGLARATDEGYEPA